MENGTTKKKGMKTWIKVIIIVAAIILILAAMAALGGFLFFNHYYNKMNYVPLDTTEEVFFTIEEEYDFPPLTDEKTPDVSDKTPAITGCEENTGESPVTKPPIVSTEPPEVTDPPKNEEPEPRKEIVLSKNVINILLIGTDNREKDHRGRSDSMILLTINKDTNQLLLTSFHRDIYLYIPVVRTYNKLNASYAYGGTSLLLKTIQRNFGLTIDKYARTDFWNFEEIINILGGVDLELSQAEIDHLHISGASSGLVHLNGAQALAYSRDRTTVKDGEGGDTVRALRQRYLLGQLFEKAKKLSVSEMMTLLDKLLPLVTTNVTRSEALGYVMNAPTFLNYKVVKNMIPVAGTKKTMMIRGMSVAVIDFDKNIEALEKILNGK